MKTADQKHDSTPVLEYVGSIRTASLPMREGALASTPLPPGKKGYLARLERAPNKAGFRRDFFPKGREEELYLLKDMALPCPVEWGNVAEAIAGEEGIRQRAYGVLVEVTEESLFYVPALSAAGAVDLSSVAAYELQARSGDLEALREKKIRLEAELTKITEFLAQKEEA